MARRARTLLRRIGSTQCAIISYGLAAEFGCHLRKGWGEPANAIDALVEFRHHTNDGRDRDRSLVGALNFFGLDSLDLAHKNAMRDRILQGPPFTEQEKREITRLLRRR